MRGGRGLCLQPRGHCLAYGQKPWPRGPGAWSMAPGRRRAAQSMARSAQAGLMVNGPQGVVRANGQWPAGRKYERRSSITALRAGRTGNGRMAASRPLQACSMRTGLLWVATGRGEDGCHSTRACWRAIMADVHCLFLCTVSCVSCSRPVRGMSGGVPEPVHGPLIRAFAWSGQAVRALRPFFDHSANFWLQKLH